MGSLSAWAQSCTTTTTISGTVYTPNGVDPLPNVLVYVPAPGTTLPTLNDGVDTTLGCGAAASLVPSNLTVSGTSNYQGKFTLSSDALAGAQTLVVQAGKWRRAYSLSVPACQTTTVTAVMPKNSSEGNIPKIAVVTGAVDSAECVLRKVGVEDSMFSDPGNGGRINFFKGTGTNDGGTGPGASIDSATPSEAALMSTASTLNGYDMLMMPCQGTAVDSTESVAANRANFVSFANNGGRVFATHWSENWLSQADTFQNVATWDNNFKAISNAGDAARNATIDTTSNPVGQTLADWLYFIGATPTKGTLPLYDLKRNVTGVSASTQVWATLDASSGYNGAIMQFTFDTPLNSTTSPTLGVSFANTPTVFKRGSTNNQVLVNVQNTGNGAADTTLALNLTASSAVTVTSVTPVNGAATGWICNGLVCSRTTSFAVGASDPVLVTLDVSAGATPGNTSVLKADLTGGNVFNVSQCGRVLFNEYHVEEPPNTLYSSSNSGLTFPDECSSSSVMTPQEKFLEFSLFNLSNFVSPSSTDSVLIQADPQVSWTPATPLYYKHPLDATVLNASSDTPGSFTYTPAAGYVAHVVESPLAVTATFTPTDTVGYATATVEKSIVILPDPTAATITSLNQDIHYGMEIGYDNGVDALLSVLVQTPGYTPGVPPDTGAFYVTIDGNTVCTGTEGSLLGGPRGNCPDAPFEGFNAGTHLLQLVYSGNTDYVGSQSPLYPVVIEPDHTVTAMTSPATPVVVNTSLTFSAAVANTDLPTIVPVGLATFYDNLQPSAAATANAPNVSLVQPGMTPIGVVSLDATGHASFSLSSLSIGTHNLSVCYGSTVNSSGTYNFLNSCSASAQIVITLPATALPGTAVTLRSSANPSVLAQSVSFTASVGTTGAFVSIPTGTVSFLDGGVPIGSGALDAAGHAVYTTSSLTVGTHNMTAVYGGSDSLTGSTSTVLQQVVTQEISPAGPGFDLIVTPTTVPVYVGSTSVVSVQVVALTNFTSAVKLSCEGLPSEASCIFADATIPSGGGITQMLVSSSAPHNCDSSTPYFASFGSRIGLSLLGLSTLTLCLARRKAFRGVALLALLVVLPGTLIGCGTGNCTDFGVKPGDYHFTVTATPLETSYAAKTQPMVLHVHL
ncbi:MAG: Ig-like domain-containing protein [Acidobacteriaceae bacterium]|nr:Ig-like domain-containing protein [Acidobacteriaceae bacterium]